MLAASQLKQDCVIVLILITHLSCIAAPLVESLALDVEHLRPYTTQQILSWLPGSIIGIIVRHVSQVHLKSSAPMYDTIYLQHYQVLECPG